MICKKNLTEVLQIYMIHIFLSILYVSEFSQVVNNLLNEYINKLNSVFK